MQPIHRNSTLEKAKSEIREYHTIYRPSLNHDERKQDIMEAVQELSPEAKKQLFQCADMVVQRMEALFKPTPENQKLGMSRENAIELLVTLFFTDDWYPERTCPWKQLQKRPEASCL